MLNACAVRFDVTNDLEKFLVGTKEVLRQRYLMNCLIVWK